MQCLDISHLPWASSISFFCPVGMTLRLALACLFELIAQVLVYLSCMLCQYQYTRSCLMVVFVSSGSRGNGCVVSSLYHVGSLHVLICIVAAGPSNPTFHQSRERAAHVHLVKNVRVVERIGLGARRGA